MTTKREQILAALFEHLLIATSLNLVRNPSLSDVVEGKALGFFDGDIELVEEFINGPVYEWTMTPTISIAFEKSADEAKLIAADRADAKVDDLLIAFEAALAVAGDLDGLVTRIELLPADLGAPEIWGAPHFKGASLPIEIDYWSDRPVG